jgi:thioredoxin reductase (NADPH)
VAPFDAVHLRALVVGSADIGEIVMRAFILRRTELITGGGAGSILIGGASDPWLVRLQGFLRRNGYPYTVLEVGTNPDATATVEKFAVAPEDLPIAICPNGSLLKRASEAELGICFGITPTLNAASVGDPMMVSVLLRLKSSRILDEYPNLAVMSPAAMRGPPTSGLSTLNWRFTPASR